MDQDTERYAVIAAALAGHATIQDAIRALYATAPGTPYRGALAAALVDRLPRDVRKVLPLYRELEALTVMADADPPADGSWRRLRVIARSMALLAAAAVSDLRDPAGALREVEALHADLDDDDTQARALLDSVRLALQWVQGVDGRDDLVGSEIWQRMQAMVGGDDSAAAVRQEMVSAMQDLAANPTGDLAGRLEHFRRGLARLPEGDPLRPAVEEMEAQLAHLVAGRSGLHREPLSRNEAALQHAAAGMQFVDPDGDPARLDEGLDHLRAALAAAHPDDPQRVFHLIGLALALLRRTEHTNDVTGLQEAESLLVEARELLPGPQDSAWSTVHGMLADVRQRLGTGGGGSLDAVEGLRTHVWQVLMQPDAAGAAAAAREAAQFAVTTAHRCLREDDVAGAVRALDAGRGLALYTATEMRTVPDRLRAAGRPDLADEWRMASRSAEPPVTLRRQVIKVLTGIAPGGALFDPPTTGQIRGALAELDLDALVYLIPATGPWPGLAVMVPSTGPLAYLSLPALRPGDSREVTDYLSGARRRGTALLERGPARDLGELDDEFTGQLDAVCDWAWRAAMGPLIERFLPSLRNPPTHRVPRLALVPMGELGLVPWQAARRTGGEPALRSAAFSQVASARMLCRSADLRPVTGSRVGMVVGDPETVAVPLLGARAEAYEIWGSFYHRGRYLGRLPGDGGVSGSGAGTAAEVRAWLTTTGRAAGGTLHLACHGVVRAGRSYLMLADGTDLAADELVKLLAEVPDRAIGLVVLAACSTGLAAGDYDEAYSLGTAFVAAGARSVLSTQWAIPDTSTFLLMFMFHHYLMVERLPAWDALHRAQLWMIGPHRPVPAAMPPALREQLQDDHGDPADVAAWAGFLHSGR